MTLEVFHVPMSWSNTAQSCVCYGCTAGESERDEDEDRERRERARDTRRRRENRGEK